MYKIAKVFPDTADDKINRVSKEDIPVKVEKSGKSLPAAPVGKGKAQAPAAKSSDTAQPSAPNSTSVHLGETTAQLQSMQGSMASSPVVNAAKVAEVKQAISEGRFQVNSTVVADRLISSVRDLLSTQKA